MSYLSPPFTDDDDVRSTSSSSNGSAKGYETKLALKLRSVDPERAARLAARAARNRISAQKSRDRKKKQVSELEQESNQLRAEKVELEERVRTLEGLVKTLLMNRNLSLIDQLDPFSIAAPKENAISPDDLLSKSVMQLSDSTVKPSSFQSSSQPQQSTSNSHACLPAAGMDSVLANDDFKCFTSNGQSSNRFSERDFSGITAHSQIGSSIDTKEGFQYETSETESISSTFTQAGQDMFEAPFCFSSSPSTVDTMSLADENLWIAHCLESGSKQDTTEYNESKNLLNSCINNTGQREDADADVLWNVL